MAQLRKKLAPKKPVRKGPVAKAAARAAVTRTAVARKAVKKSPSSFLPGLRFRSRSSRDQKLRGTRTFRATVSWSFNS